MATYQIFKPIITNITLEISKKKYEKGMRCKKRIRGALHMTWIWMNTPSVVTNVGQK